MKVPSVLAAAILLTSTRAVDIGAWAGQGCLGDAYLQCTNLPSNICCNILGGQGSGLHGASSGLWSGLPDPSLIVGGQEDRDGDPCGFVVSMHVINGGDVCVNLDPNSGQFAGFSYTVISSRFTEPISPDQLACKASMEPDTVILSNGTEYDMTKMSAKQKEDIRTLIRVGNSASSLPDAFSKFKKTNETTPMPKKQ